MTKTLVFGASLKSERYSNMAIKRLLSKGIQTEAFGLRSGLNRLKVVVHIQKHNHLNLLQEFFQVQ